MKMLFPCCAVITLHLSVSPSAAQEVDPADSVGLQSQPALGNNALAVLPVEILTTNHRAPAFATEAYELILNELASIDGLYVIGRESVLAYADSTLPAVEIAHGLGVGNILKSSIRADLYTISLDAELIDARTGESHGLGSSLLRVSPNLHIPNPPFDLNTLMPDMASRVAAEVQSVLFPTADPQPDPQPSIADNRAIALDTSRSDSERLDALRRLPLRREEVSGGVFIATAVQIATTSAEPGVRAGIWREMVGVADPYLIQPLLDALVNDIEDGVRRAAARTLLADFLDRPEVRVALEFAALNDASERVRNEIRLSLLPEAEREEALRTIVLDTTKPDSERLGAAYDLRHSGGSPLVFSSPKELSTEAITAIVGLARTTGSRHTRLEALRILRGADDPYLIEPLLIALANDAYELVRDAAAQGLAEFLDEDGVRGALEEASANDPSPLVRKTAREVLVSASR